VLTTQNTLYHEKFGTNFTDKRRSLGRYSLLADYGQGVWLGLAWRRGEKDQNVNDYIVFIFIVFY
jgi:hypothetical protein